MRKTPTDYLQIKTDLRGRSGLIVLITVVVWLSISKKSFGQEPGIYRDHFYHELILKPDSTFMFTWRFDLASSWNEGTWTRVNNALSLTVVPVYDTLIRQDTNGKISKELVISKNRISEILDEQRYSLDQITGGGQSRVLPPIKLLIKKDQLRLLRESGKTDRKKRKPILGKKKFRGYFRLISPLDPEDSGIKQH